MEPIIVIPGEIDMLGRGGKLVHTQDYTWSAVPAYTWLGAPSRDSVGGLWLRGRRSEKPRRIPESHRTPHLGCELLDEG